MIKQLTDFIVSNNLKEDKGLFYGIYHGKIISLISRGSLIKVSIALNKAFLDREKGQECAGKIKTMRQNYKIVQQALVTQAAVELYFYLASDIATLLPEVVDNTIEIIDEFFNCGIENCPICNNMLVTNDPYVRIRDLVIQAHPTCVEQLEGQSKMAINSIKNVKITMWKELLICFFGLFAITLIMAGLGALQLFSYTAFLSGSAYLIFIRYFKFRLKMLGNLKTTIIEISFALATFILSMYFSSCINLFMINRPEYDLGYFMTHYFEVIVNVDFIIYDVVFGLLLIAMDAFGAIKRSLLSTKDIIKKL